MRMAGGVRPCGSRRRAGPQERPARRQPSRAAGGPQLEGGGDRRDGEEADQRDDLERDGAEQQPVAGQRQAPGRQRARCGRRRRWRAGRARRRRTRRPRRSAATPSAWRLPELPAAPRSTARKASISTSGLRRAEDAERAAQQRARRRGCRLPGGRSIARRLGRLRTERERGQQVGADVEGEDLSTVERQRDRAAGERQDGERRELGDVVGEVVGEEAAHVGRTWRGPARPR